MGKPSLDRVRRADISESGWQRSRADSRNRERIAEIGDLIAKVGFKSKANFPGKDELISVAVEMGLVIPSKAKIIDLKKLIESSAVYKNDIEFVRSLVENALEKSKQEAEKNEREAEKIEREAEIQLEKIKLSQIEKQLELEKVRKKSEKNPQTLESGEKLGGHWETGLINNPPSHIG
ncbi:hypothetical protein TNCV_709071 [Trichonephila clavipes]|nr:hypothetical protein TNCV_709071 [Trichonephila clavipes]